MLDPNILLVQPGEQRRSSKEPRILLGNSRKSSENLRPVTSEGTLFTQWITARTVRCSKRVGVSQSGVKHSNPNLVLNLFPLLFRHTTELHGIAAHPQLDALLQAAVLASVPVHSIDCTILLSGALISHVRSLASAEESLKGSHSVAVLLLSYMIQHRHAMNGPHTGQDYFHMINYSS